MLSQEVMDKLIDRIVLRVEETNRRILEEIGQTIKTIGEMNPSKANQLVQILKYGGSYNKIVRELAKITELNVKDIEEIFTEVARSNYRFAEKFYLYKNIDYVPFEDNLPLKLKVKAIANITANEYINLSKTSSLGFGLQDDKGNVIFRGIKETYNEIIDEAVLSLAQGKETFNKQMKKRIKELSSEGIKVIYPTTYKTKDIDGNPIIKHYTRRIDSAVRMNISDALHQLHSETQEIIGGQFGADGVEITVHYNPAPDHAELQGKQFSNEEYEKLNNGDRAITYDKKVIPFDNRRRPIGELNCQHDTYKIILGVSKPAYSNELLEEIKNKNEKGFEYEDVHYTNYEGTQLQRMLETKIRQQKDYKAMAEESGNTDAILDANRKIRILKKKYQELCSASHLRPNLGRLTI